MLLTSRVVAFDIHNILGYVSPAKKLYETIVDSSNLGNKYLQQFAKLLSNGLIRPHLREMLVTLQLWQQQGRIDSVDIFTTEHNHNNWIIFLVECIEICADVSGLFNRVFCGEDCFTAITDLGRCLVKDLSKLSYDSGQVVIIQGKPEYIVNGMVIGIPDYCSDPELTQFKNYLISELDVETGEVDKFLSKYIDENLKKQYCGDSDEEVFPQVINHLEVIFPSPSATSNDINL